MNTTDKAEKWTLKTLKARGWTDKAIAAMLPQPELKTNPFYKCAAPMKLWVADIVIQQENTEEFAAVKAQKEKRQASARKAVATKKAHTKKHMQFYIDRIADFISVDMLSPEELRVQTLRAKQQWYNAHDRFEYVRDAENANEETIHRWEVNYLRHRMSDYDSMLDDSYDRVGWRECANLFRDVLFDRIAQVYPFLSEECERQKQRSKF